MYVFTLIFGVFLWIAVLALYLRRPAASAFHPMTFMLFFQFVIFVLRPILAYVYDFHNLYIAYDFMPTTETKVTALLVADLAFVVFGLSSLYWGSLPLKIISPKIDVRISNRILPSFLLTSLLIAPLGILSLRSNFNEQAAGTTTMIMDAATGNSVNTSGNGYFQNLAISLATLAVVFAWINRFRILSLLPFVAYVIFRGSTGGRFPFVMATGSLLLLYLWEKRRRWFSARLIWPIVGVIAFFGVIGADRGQGLRAILLQDNNQIRRERSLSERPLESMDYGNMEFSEYIVQTVPEKTGTYDYFASNLILFTGPIPRALWPGKPIGPPVQFFSWFDYGNPIGMTMSLGGWGWYELGWLGVVIWAALSGSIYGLIYNAFIKSRQTVHQVAAYLTFLPLSLLYYRDGSMPEIVNLVAFEVLPVLAWVAVARITLPEDRRAAQ